MTGLEKEDAEFFGIEHVPAVQVVVGNAEVDGVANVSLGSI